MPPGADMEWGAIVMWAALGFVGCAVALVAALIGFVTQSRIAKSGSDDAGTPNHR